MSDGFLFDTDVLIDMLKGNEHAIRFLEESMSVIYISAITMAELQAGVRNRREQEQMDNFFEELEIISVLPEIAREAGVIRNVYGKSHGSGLADCIIAATAKIQNIPLITLNRKHFPMIQNIIIPYRK